ncbi:hypothetical protein GFH48_15245 [Streptomyces fagopyri]|uniref:Uncharacterized protein n=1 Tax=Streptomyces fagopyri TaxID=2662397 RepID=A0A5Q0LC03_9ACTN|nr:hypothetical protein GFH48_15245 [Streptomyces fagopyri]
MTDGPGRPGDRGDPGAAAPDLPPLGMLCAAIARVRSVKFCARTAHTRVTEKYDGGAAHTASGQFWEAA